MYTLDLKTIKHNYIVKKTMLLVVVIIYYKNINVDVNSHTYKLIIINTLITIVIQKINLKV